MLLTIWWPSLQVGPVWRLPYTNLWVDIWVYAPRILPLYLRDTTESAYLYVCGSGQCDTAVSGQCWDFLTVSLPAFVSLSRYCRPRDWKFEGYSKCGHFDSYISNSIISYDKSISDESGCFLMMDNDGWFLLCICLLSVLNSGQASIQPNSEFFDPDALHTVGPPL